MTDIATATTIDGLRVLPRRRIPDERGAILHMLRADSPEFERFGEIYFSTVYRGATKAWKRHRRITLNYACAFGRVKVVLCDTRESSPTIGAVMEIFLGPDNYSLVVIPPGIWSGFAGMSDPLAVLANCATEPHDPTEIDRLDPATPSLPYRW